MENSVFAEKNMFFFVGKDRFVIKIPVLAAKTTFSRRKEYFTFEIVFYSGNHSFVEKKFRFFFGGKDRFVIKKRRKRGFLVEKSTLHLK